VLWDVILTLLSDLVRSGVFFIAASWYITNAMLYEHLTDILMVPDKAGFIVITILDFVLFCEPNIKLLLEGCHQLLFYFTVVREKN
jgi:hypothetical protein